MFYPIIKLDNFQGFTTVHNFSPNNWEKSILSEKLIYVIWSDGFFWNTYFISKISINESKNINSNNLPDYIFINNLAFIYASNEKLNTKLTELPIINHFNTHTPNWRATIGIENNKTRVSYQGEVEPFPVKSSLLTFHPFLQFNGFNNYLLLLNLVKTPKIYESDLEIYNLLNNKYIATKKIKSNSASLISINDFNFKTNDLPIFVNRTMAAIPFGFGYNNDQTILSLEHTHPPASLVLHGNRFIVQSKIKEKWFNNLKND